jgi:3-oxoadipate enol-lactonase
MVMDHVTLGDGTRLAYRFDGAQDAPVLLLSNSLGTHHAMWEPQMASLTQHFRVLRYDQRGHGASDAPPGAASMDRLGRDVVELLDALGLQKVHFCGLSLGGMVGQWLAAHARKDRQADPGEHLGLYGPALRVAGADRGCAGQRHDTFGRGIDRALVHAGFPEAAPEAVAPIHAMLLANDPAGYAACCAAIRDMDQRPTAHLNRLPTLVIAGARIWPRRLRPAAFWWRLPLTPA